MDTALIVAVVGVIGSVVGIVLSLRKYPHEMHKLDAESLETYAKAAKIQQDRYDALEKKFDDYKAQIEERISALEEENRDLKDWAERLVHQVQSLGAIPVKMRSKRAIHNN